MDESEYLSIPECYMKEIPKEVWYSWPIEIRRDFFRMISDPNLFFFNNRQFNQEVYGENIEISDFEKKEFWKRVDYFFSNLGIKNLRSFDTLWGYFAIPFPNRTGQILKYYFYLPENKRKLLSKLTYYNIGGNSQSLVKIDLLEKEAQVFILSFIRIFVMTSTMNLYVPDSMSIANEYIKSLNQKHDDVNENLMKPEMSVNPTDSHFFTPSNIKTSNNYTLGYQHQEIPIGYIPTTKSEFSPIDQSQNQPLENNESQNQNSLSNIEQPAPNTEKRGRGRPRKYPATDPPPIHIPKKRGRKKKSELSHLSDISNRESDYIDQAQTSLDQSSNAEQSEAGLLSNISTESENQKDRSNDNSASGNDKNDGSSNSEKPDDETDDDSEQLLRQFIVSDSSYSYDSDDKDDEEYQETTTRPRNYSLKGKRKNKKNKKQTIFLNFQRGMAMNENRNNYYNQLNGYNIFSSINNGRFPRIAIINIQPSSQNNTQPQIYKISQPIQFIQEDSKIGIQGQSPAYPRIYQIQPQQITPSHFQTAQTAHELHIAPLSSIDSHSIQVLPNTPQKVITSQIPPIQSPKIPASTYSNTNNDLSSFLQTEKAPPPINIGIEQPPSSSSQPSPSSSIQNFKKVKKYLLGKIEGNPQQQDIVLPPIGDPETFVKRSDYPTPTNNILISGNSPSITSKDLDPEFSDHQTTFNPNQINKKIADSSFLQNFEYPTNQQISSSSLPPQIFLGNQPQSPVQKRTENQQDYESETDYNSADDEINKNYSSSDNESKRSTFSDLNQSAAFQTEESSSESEKQNEEVDTEINEYYDNEYENSEAEIENEPSNHENQVEAMRNRRNLHKTIQFSSEDSDDEPKEITGIVSSLTYIYDECNNTNDSSRISKTKPSSLIDLEFK